MGARPQPVHVARVAQVTVLDCRRFSRVHRRQANFATTVGDVDFDEKSGQPAHVEKVAGIERNLQVVQVETRLAARLERCSHADVSGIHRVVCVECHHGHRMIEEVLAHTGKVESRIDAGARQLLSRTDAGAHQDCGCVIRACGKDNASRPDLFAILQSHAAHV